MKKIFSFEIYEGDKGIILADSREEAIEIFKKAYPYHMVCDNNDIDSYYASGAFLVERAIDDGTSKIVTTLPW
jgi:hypothetical protein